MPRFFAGLVCLAGLSYVITSIALPADGPEESASAQPAPANLAPVYVKIIWPDSPRSAKRLPTESSKSDGPATPAIEKDRPVVESWITRSIENRNKANFKAVTGWVPLALGPLDATELWDGKFDGGHATCIVDADIFERKGDSMKIMFSGWGPGGGETTVALKDEPGSREVVPITKARTKHGVAHVAIFIGLPAKRNDGQKPESAQTGEKLRD